MHKNIIIILLFSFVLTIQSQVEYKKVIEKTILPTGEIFKTWENNTEYSKIYYVDQNHPKASDSNPGTEAEPLLTINRAAQLVRTGEKVVIKRGVYREKIIPKYGGESDKKMISYESFPEDEVIIKGSFVLEEKWERSLNPTQYSEKLWMTTLPDSVFPHQSPFKIQNANADDIKIMPWAEEWVGRAPYTLTRGMIFQDGERLSELVAYEDLVRVPGAYWVDSSGTVLHIHPFDKKNPNDTKIEITFTPHLFKPEQIGLSFIQVKGLTFMHAGNGFPRTGTGSLFTNGGHHWIIEKNKFDQMNSVALEVGALWVETSDLELREKAYKYAVENPGYMIVRRNEISNCGTGGIQGMFVKNALIEDNHIYNIGWQDVERYWECSAIKVLLVTNSLVRRNLIHDVEAASAIWIDWNNHNVRVTQNTVFDLNMCCNGGLFIEASRVWNMIDHNIVMNVHGIGIYGGDSDSLIIAHNLIVNTDNSGIHCIVGTDRSMNGRPFTSVDHRIFNNLFETEAPIFFDSAQNYSDNNVFDNDFDLVGWRKKGFDENSYKLGFTTKFDREILELAIYTQGDIPQVETNDLFKYDFNNNSRNSKTVTGPFNNWTGKQYKINIDPRKLE